MVFINRTATLSPSFILFKHKEGLSLSQINDELIDNGFKSMSKMGIKKIIDRMKKTTQTQNDTSANDIEEDIQQTIENDDWAKWLFPISPKN